MIDPYIKPSRMACGSRRNLTNLPVQYALFPGLAAQATQHFNRGFNHHSRQTRPTGLPRFLGELCESCVHCTAFILVGPLISASFALAHQQAAAANHRLMFGGEKFAKPP